MKFFNSIQNYVKYLVLILLVTPFFFWWFSHAVDDLLRQLFVPAKSNDTIINLGDNVNTVWNKVIKWSTEIGFDWVSKSPSIIIKVTRLLLILVVALSVTMILYNWLTYIIQTWQWKEWKGLIKNVILIVVGILVALFSVVIINIIQSIPTTIDTELQKERDNESDNKALKWEKMEWNDVWGKLKDADDPSDLSEIEAENAIINKALQYFTGDQKPYTGIDSNWKEIWLIKLNNGQEFSLVQAFLDEKL